MIQIARTDAPAVLRNNAGEWLRRLHVATTKTEQRKAQRKYGHIKIRAALESMFNSKCAYCESIVTHISFTHIEHFRPKVRYPRYTFAWKNLLLSCPKCNSAQFKGDNFPLRAEGGPIVNPTKEDPSSHLQFNYDTGTKSAIVTALTTRGTATIRLLGLNRPELVKARSDAIRKLIFVKLHEAHDHEAVEILDDARRNDAGYLAFVRSLSL